MPTLTLTNAKAPVGPQDPTIIKIQLSLSTTHNKDRVLIYNHDRSVHYEGEARPFHQQLMGSRKKAFFHFHMSGTTLVIDKEAPHQDW